MGVAELLHHAGREARHDGGDGKRHESAGLDEIAEDASEPLGGAFVARLDGPGDDPGLLGFDEPVAGPHELPERGKRLVEEAPLELRRVRIADRRPRRPERALPRAARIRALAAKVAGRHRHGPVHEVAEIVGEVRVVTAGEQVPRDVTVAVEAGFAERDVARAVAAERIHEVDRVEEVAAALAHPLAVGQEPAVNPHPPRRREPGRPEHRGPEDRVEARDVLADHVEVGRPPAREFRRVVGEAGPGDVVDERVVPDVDRAGGRVPGTVRELRAAPVGEDRERDPPPRIGPADGEVLQAAADEAQHLVAPMVGRHEVRVLLEPALEALLVGREPEEPVPLGQPLERDVRVVRTDRAESRLDDVGGVAEPLVGTVPALVHAEVDVAAGVRPADHLLGRAEMVRVRGPDEAVGGDCEGPLGGSEARDLLVHEVPRRALLLGRPHRDVDAVLVRAGQETRGDPGHAVPARQHVGPDHLVERVESGPVVRVGDRGGDEEAVGLLGHGRPIVAGPARAPRPAGPCPGGRSRARALSAGSAGFPSRASSRRPHPQRRRRRRHGRSHPAGRTR